MTARADALLERAFSCLEAAPADRGSEFRLLQLATVAPDGAPELRTLVLRRFERSPLVATFHADRRSAKIRAISAAPRVALLAWSDAMQLQVRMTGEARIHTGDDVARAEWDALSSGARATYTLAAIPGTPVTDAEADAHIHEADALGQFAVLRIAAARLDILELGPKGAQFRVRAAADDPVAGRVGA